MIGQSGCIEEAAARSHAKTPALSITSGVCGVPGFPVSPHGGRLRSTRMAGRARFVEGPATPVAADGGATCGRSA
eukprot:11194561-Lingulodinium_polyedra.AAC.1